jgi:hypothetical protein
MKPFCVLLSLCLGCFAQDGKEVQITPTCVATSFTGSVKRGLPFVQTIGDGLTYQLIPAQSEVSDPAHPPKFVGWTIRIAYLKNRGEMEREFSESMTQRYRGHEPRDLNTNSGRTVKQVLGARHDVFFATTLLDSASAEEILDNIQHSISNFDVKRSALELLRIPAGSAKFTIIDQKLDGDLAASTEILALSFKIDLTVPTTVKLSPELKSRAKPCACPVIDFLSPP